MKRTFIAPESMKNKHIEIIEGSPPIQSDESISHRRALAKFDSKKQFIYPLERITQGTVVIRQVKFPGADAAYPDVTHALYRFVSSYYPYAQGGPLYVDEPKNEKEVFRAYERQKVMKKLGLRHVIIDKDTTYEDLLEQLGTL